MCVEHGQVRQQKELENQWAIGWRWMLKGIARGVSQDGHWEVILSWKNWETAYVSSNRWEQYKLSVRNSQPGYVISVFIEYLHYMLITLEDYRTIKSWLCSKNVIAYENVWYTARFNKNTKVVKSRLNSC